MKGNMRLSVIGSSNNMNEQGFGMQDLVGAFSGGGGGGGFGGGGGGGGGRGFGGGGGAPSGQAFQMSRSTGISTNHSAGLNFSNEWKKIKFNASYFFNYSDNDNYDLTNRSYLLSSLNNQNYLDTTKSNRINGNHRMNFRLEYAIDSFNNIMWRSNLSYQDNDQTSFSNRKTYMGEDVLTNWYRSSSDNSRQGTNLNTFLMYTHSFNKKGRSISLNTNLSYSDRPGINFNNSLTTYYRYDTITRTDTTDRRVRSLSGSNALSGSISYTEPVGKIAQLMFNYTARLNFSNSDRRTYDLLGNGYGEIMDTLLSNTFDNTYTTHRAGVNLRLKIGNTNATAGVNYQEAILGNKQKFPDQYEISQSFGSVLPSLMVQSKFGKNSLQGFYNTNTNPPDVTQLQNVVDNSNPLNVTAGNPDLKEEYSHSLMFRYTGVKSSNMMTFMAMVGGSYTTNRIAQSTFFSAKDDTINVNGVDIPLGAGATFSQPVNMKNPAWNVRTFLTFGIPVTKLKFNVNLNSGVTYSGTPGYLNNIENTTRTTSLNEGLVIASNISEKVDFTLSGNLAYNLASYSSNPDTITTYLTQRYSAKIHLILPGNFFIDGNASYLLNKGLTDGYNLSYSLVNCSVGKYLMKNKSLEIRATVFDVLNQNDAITRNITESYIEDVRNLSLRRYYMLTITYNFRNFTLPERKDDHDHSPMGPGGERRFMPM
jgi:hypothetical protein